MFEECLSIPKKTTNIYAAFTCNIINCSAFISKLQATLVPNSAGLGLNVVILFPLFFNFWEILFLSISGQLLVYFKGILLIWSIFFCILLHTLLCHNKFGNVKNYELFDVKSTCPKIWLCKKKWHFASLNFGILISIIHDG